MADIGDTFKPGDIVPHSGIYRVLHDTHHRSEHEVTCVYGKKFPPCNHCGCGRAGILPTLAHTKHRSNIRMVTAGRITPRIIVRSPTSRHALYRRIEVSSVPCTLHVQRSQYSVGTATGHESLRK